MNKLLAEQQHGFRGGRSCEAQLRYTLQMIYLAYNREAGSITDVVILGFSKAFDTVSHKKLLHKVLVS